MNAAIIYWSKTGNTKKVAKAIQESLLSLKAKVKHLTVNKAYELDIFDYDLICIGFPIYGMRPPPDMEQYLYSCLHHYEKRGRIVLCAPKVPGKYVIVFVTYTGAHTGVSEAIPATKYVASAFEHLGFAVLDEIHVVGEYHGKPDYNTKGKLGDIRGRPNKKDLINVKKKIKKLLQHI